MAIITVVYQGETRTLTAQDGAGLGELLRDHAAAPHMFCGGKGTCGKCKVRAEGALSPLTAEEEKLLTPAKRDGGIRLSCLTKVLGDCRVELTGGPLLENIRVSGYMPEFSRDPLFENYGAAVDIGTTTLVAQLYGQDGLLGSVSTHNPQRSFGADVISRIGKALEGDGPLLAGSVRGAIASLLEALQQNAGLPPKSIDSLVITGNTAMLYLLTGRDPDCLSHAPFEADELFGCFVEAEALELPCKTGAKVYLPRCMSAFVGGDITTAVLAGEICAEPGRTKFLVDIGTNGEMALWHAGRLLCCSTAAGPTFEGAGISMGMQGATGAIDHVEKESLEIHVIGDGTAKGICGSGIVDAVSAMLHHEAIDENGLMEEEAFFLSDRVSVNQKDIRMVQLAKSAICAGVLTLLDEAGVDRNAIFSFSIAGGFGSYLDLKSAAEIGLYPQEFEDRAIVLGNAALSGSSMLLLNKAYLPQAEALAKSAETIELTTSPVFMDNYVDCMMFE